MNMKKLSEKHYIYCEGERELSVLTVLKQCHLLLLLKTGWRQGRMLGRKEGKVMSSGLLSLQQAKEFEHIGWDFNLVIVRLSQDESLLTMKGVCLD